MGVNLLIFDEHKMMNEMELLENLNNALMLAQFRVSEMNDRMEAEASFQGCVSGRTAALYDMTEGFEDSLLYAIALTKHLNDDSDRSYSPDEVSCPGETIADLLEYRGLTMEDLVDKLECTTRYAKDVIEGKEPLTQRAAIALEDLLDCTSEFWMNRGANFA